MPLTSVEITEILNREKSTQELRMLDYFSKIDSLISPYEALALYRIGMTLPRNSRILEIGSFKGGSTSAIGQAALDNDLTMYCIDVWTDYTSQADFSDMKMADSSGVQVLSEFIRNTAFIEDRLCVMRGEINKFKDVLRKNTFKLVFIDGAHDYYSVVDDIISSLNVLEPGGFLCGHDYHSAGVAVKKAVHDVIMKSETVSVKGVIAKTSIWFAVIDDPEYELLIARVIRHMARKEFAEAYAVIRDGRGSVKHTEEIDRLHAGLEAELGIGTSSPVGD